MRIWIFLLLFSTAANALPANPPVRAREECGFYQADDFGDGIVYTLTDLLSFPNRVMTFTITNPSTPLIQSLVSMRCYCIVGYINRDLSYRNDPLFKVMQVLNVTTGPYDGCNP